MVCVERNTGLLPSQVKFMIQTPSTLPASTSSTALPSIKPTFSGHESFACRQFWLKKGVDYLSRSEDARLSAADAVVRLGVGKNMVTSLQYWLKAFGLVDETGAVSPFAHKLLADDGLDPYLEDIGSLWLLHSCLVTTGRATTYRLVFNEFRKERIEFTRQQLQDFLSRKCLEWDVNVVAATLQRDVDTFVKTYLRPKGRGKQVEDDFTSLLIDLQLVTETEMARAQGGALLKIESSRRASLPAHIVLFSILSANHDRSIPFTHLLNAADNPGAVFALSAEGLYAKLMELVERYPSITFTDDAGVRELQFREPLDRWQVLEDYYRRAA